MYGLTLFLYKKMAEEGTLCVNADVVKLAGAQVNTTYIAEAYTNEYIKSVEGIICARARYDFVTNYSSISTIGKQFLKNLTASGAAMKAITQDLSDFPGQSKGEILLDALALDFNNGLNLLMDDKFKVFIKEGED